MKKKNMNIIGVIGLRGFPDIMGGVEKHCESLYPRIAALGNISFFVCRRAPYISDHIKKKEYRGVKFLDILAPRSKYFEAISHTLFCLIILRIKGIKTVHVHNIGPGLSLPIARLLGMKTILTFHSPNYEHRKWNTFARFVLRGAEVVACRFAIRVITVSKQFKNDLELKYGNKFVAISNGVSIQTPIPSGTILQKFDITPKQYFLFVGRIVPEKRVEDALEAFSRLNTNWKLVLVGDADHEDSYSEAIKSKANRSRNVIMTGFASGEVLREIFSNAGCFVLPSSHEGNPIALLEALSYGLPCIVSDISANREIDFSEIKMYPMGNVSVLSDSMKSVIDAIDVFYPQRAVQFVSMNYDWDKVAKSTEAIFMEVL